MLHLLFYEKCNRQKNKKKEYKLTKINIISEYSEHELMQKVNNFIEKEKILVKDIKFNSVYVKYWANPVNPVKYSAMIIYETKGE